MRRHRYRFHPMFSLPKSTLARPRTRSSEPLGRLRVAAAQAAQGKRRPGLGLWEQRFTRQSVIWLLHPKPSPPLGSPWRSRRSRWMRHRWLTVALICCLFDHPPGQQH